MKPTITKLKDARGRITGYRAELGAVTRDGKTVAEANEACEHATLEALARLDKGASAHAWNGHTFTIAPDLYGWSYVLPGHMPQSAGENRETAITSALHHLAQVTWTHETDDAAFLASLPDAKRFDGESLASELAGWIRFQRAYKVRAAQGLSDTECHRLACEDSYKVAS